MTLSRRTIFKSGAGAAAALALTSTGAAAASAGSATSVDYTGATTRFLEIGGRKLSYRRVGTGKPLVLLNRFRGTLDTWDPLFIDSLAAEGFEVITFDYSGLGLSTGERSYDPPALVKDARELILGLGLKDVAIGGWSLGGIVAQIYLAMFSAEVSHVVLIGTTPPGLLVKPAEQLFYDTAGKPGVDLDQFTQGFAPQPRLVNPQALCAALPQADRHHPLSQRLAGNLNSMALGQYLGCQCRPEIGIALADHREDVVALQTADPVVRRSADRRRVPLQRERDDLGLSRGRRADSTRR